MPITLNGLIKARFISNLISICKRIGIGIILKISVLISVVLLLAGSLLFVGDQTLSQEFGYWSFITLIISSALLFIYIFLNRNCSGVEKTVTAEESNHFSLVNFFLANALASSLLILISLRLIVFGNSLTGISNPNSVFNNEWPFPFTLISGYTGNGQGFIVQNFFQNLLTLFPMPLILYQKVLIIFELYFYYFLAAVSIVLYRAIGIKSISISLFSVLFSYLFVANFIYRSEGFERSSGQ